MNQPLPLLLFCLPHAGGSAGFYQPLARHLPSYIHFVPIELPGKGMRSAEQPCEQFELLAADAAAQMDETLHQAGHNRYALFGHSFGALLAWHLAHLCAAYPPMHVFLSSPPLFFPQGHCPPDGRPALHTLSRVDLLARLENLGGLPQSDAALPALFSYMEPLIRADFAALESWKPALRPPLDVPMTLLGGNEEPHHMAAHWAARTTADFAVHGLPGGHFYLVEHWDRLGTLVDHTMEKTMRNSCTLACAAAHNVG